jgi:hypothetical protein
MKLIRGGLVSVGTFELVADLDCDEHEGSKDSDDPLVLAGEGKGVGGWRLGLREEVVGLDGLIYHFGEGLI